jgi:hypothetical protein
MGLIPNNLVTENEKTKTVVEMLTISEEDFDSAVELYVQNNIEDIIMDNIVEVLEILEDNGYVIETEFAHYNPDLQSPYSGKKNAEYKYLR